MINHVYSSSNHTGVCKTWQAAKTTVMEYLETNSEALEVHDETLEEREAARQEYDAHQKTSTGEQPQQMDETAEEVDEDEDEDGVEVGGDPGPRIAKARALLKMPMARAKTTMPKTPMPPKAPPPSHIAPKSQQATKMEELREKKNQENFAKMIQTAVAKGVGDSIVGIPQKRALPGPSSSSNVRDVKAKVESNRATTMLASLGTAAGHPDQGEVVNLVNPEETTTVPIRLLHEMQQSMRRVIQSCDQAARVSSGVKVVVEGFSNSFIAERQNAAELPIQLENAMQRIPS